MAISTAFRDRDLLYKEHHLIQRAPLFWSLCLNAVLLPQNKHVTEGEIIMCPDNSLKCINTTRFKWIHSTCIQQPIIIGYNLLTQCMLCHSCTLIYDCDLFSLLSCLLFDGLFHFVFWVLDEKVRSEWTWLTISLTSTAVDQNTLQQNCFLTLFVCLFVWFLQQTNYFC